MASTMIGACCRWSSANMVSISIMGLLFWSKSARLDRYSSRMALLDAIATTTTWMCNRFCFRNLSCTHTRTTNTTTLRNFLLSAQRALRYSITPAAPSDWPSTNIWKEDGRKAKQWVYGALMLVTLRGYVAWRRRRKPSEKTKLRPNECMELKTSIELL